jgi:hypothetical protein
MMRREKRRNCKYRINWNISIFNLEYYDSHIFDKKYVNDIKIISLELNVSPHIF